MKQPDKKPKDPKPKRRLKVTAAYRRNRYSHTFVPRIHLCGQWLKAHGYETGCAVEIEIKDNELIIRKAA